MVSCAIHIFRFLDPDLLDEVPRTSKWRCNQEHVEGAEHAELSSEDEDNGEIDNSEIHLDIPTFEGHKQNNQLENDMPKLSNTDRSMDSPLYPGSDVTLAQFIVMILAFSLRHSLSATAIEDHLKLLSILLPANNILPHSLHVFKQLLKDPSDTIKLHFFCQGCGARLSKQNTHCLTCGEESNNDNLKEGNFFISLSLANQIRDIIQREGLSDCTNTILGKTDYKPGDVSLLWNCDGVPLFNSSSNSLWPIRCIINELPAEVRYKNVVLAGVWFGQGKPDMATFLHQFVQDIKDTNAHGIEWVHPRTGISQMSKVFPITCSCDAVAKCALQGIHQFNGSYGCGYCLNEGMVVAKGRGYTRVYPDVEADMRSHKHTVECGAKAIDEGVSHVLGVKSVSPLILLHPSTGFDMIKSFSVDYMHCVLLGVTKQFLDIWLNSKYHSEPWYIGTSKNKIDERLLPITPPSDVPRVPRTLHAAHRWKAAECRSWLLFYSLPVLHMILPNKYLKHWSMLVNTIFLLLKDKVTNIDLASASNYIKKFVHQIPEIYGMCHMSYNVHQLTHLICSVELHGPLWSSSAFVFEGHNQKLTRLCHGTQSIPNQIAFRFNLLQSLPSLLEQSNSPDNITHRVNKIVNDWIDGYPLRSKAVRLQDIVLLGCPQHKKIGEVEHCLLVPIWGPQEMNLIGDYYHRAVLRGKVFTTEEYGKGHKHNSYTVELRNGSIGVIKSIINIYKNMPVFLIQLFRSETACFVSETVNHLKLVCPTQVRVAVKYSDIIRKVVFMKIEKKEYVSLQPNGTEID